ncbi:hypothetical protein Pcinc_026156, partial [Petrolisthes cinctipes]
PAPTPSPAILNLISSSPPHPFPPTPHLTSLPTLTSLPSPAPPLTPHLTSLPPPPHTPFYLPTSHRLHYSPLHPPLPPLSQDFPGVQLGATRIAIVIKEDPHLETLQPMLLQFLP